MKTILIFGAGRSATSLIQYLLDHSTAHSWRVVVADLSLELAQQKIGGHPNGEAVQLSALDAQQRRTLIQQSDIVVSMLPATLHAHVAQDCLEFGKSLCNASYVAPEIAAMHQKVADKGILFLCELGLDPGIDHMSAMQLIHHLRAQGADIEAFRSYTGGLVAPESDDNPWHYKFSWNPRNVVVAGQGTAKYLQDGGFRYLPYHRLFAEAEDIFIPEMGVYEMYPNRNSLTYRHLYQLESVPTLVRGTLRHQGYCKAWNILVQLGLTDDSYSLENPASMSYAEYFRAFLPANFRRALSPTEIYERLSHHFGGAMNADIWQKLEYLDLFSDAPIGLANATPAQVLQKRLEEKWQLRPEDKDMIIMQHEFIYTLNGKRHKHLSTLVQLGQDGTNTAMSSLVGIPLAIGVKHVLLGNIRATGVHIPVHPAFYTPIMEELAQYGVAFKESVVELP